MREVGGQRAPRAHADVSAEGLALLVELPFADHHEAPVQSIEHYAYVLEERVEGERTFGHVDQMRRVVRVGARQRCGRGEPSGVTPEHLEDLNDSRQCPIVGAEVARG